MKDEESGTVIGLSMVLTAIVKSLPKEVAAQAARELRTARLGAKANDEADGTSVIAAQTRDQLTELYLDGLKQVADGSALLVGGKKEKARP